MVHPMRISETFLYCTLTLARTNCTTNIVQYQVKINFIVFSSTYTNLQVSWYVFFVLRFMNYLLVLHRGALFLQAPCTVCHCNSRDTILILTKKYTVEVGTFFNNLIDIMFD